MNRARTLSVVRPLSFPLVAVFAAISGSHAVGAPTGPADHINARAAQALGVRACEVLEVIMAGSPAEGVLAAVPFGPLPLVLDLEPASVRTEGYTLLVQGADGSVQPAPSSPATTMRGSVVGEPGSAVAATITESGLVARIIHANGEESWVEPVGHVIGGAPDGHAFYRGSDVLEHGGSCAALAAAHALPAGEAGGDGTAGSGTAGAEGLQIAELACDADYEFFQDYGTVTAVEDRINSVINAMNLQYESEVGISHLITTIIVRTAEPDPYSSTDASTLLNQFRNHWNSNHGSVPRDVAQLFTGKAIDGSTIGIAWLNAVCTSYGYGVVQSDFNSNFSSATDLSAHELGHNWGADHCSCPSNTMNPYITSANTFHATETVPDIVSFRDSRSCLDDGSPPPPPPDPTGGCCVDSSCSVLTETDCADAGGVYLGDDTDCADSPCLEGGDVVNLAVADHSTASGTIASGTFATTHAQDDVAQVLVEQHTGGRPSGRRSVLSHTWRFQVAPGSSYTFVLDAHRDANGEGDDFLFSYSLDNTSFVPLVLVSKSADDDVVDAMPFAEEIAGTVYIRVEDTDRTTGNGGTDAVHVDEMFILTVGDPDFDPPAAPTNLAAAAGFGLVSLDWDDNAEADLAGYQVYRALAAGGPYSPIGTMLAATSDYVDDAVAGDTTYFYVVTALDLAGNESADSNEAWATVGPFGPATMHVAGITATTDNVGGGNRRGRVEVLVVDDLGDPVTGAVVTGSFGGAFAETHAAATGSNGIAVLVSDATAKGKVSFTWCVDDVAGALTYDAPSNAVNCAGN